MGVKKEYDKDGKPAFQVKSLGHTFKVKRTFAGDSGKYVVSSFRIDSQGNMTLYSSEDMDDYKEFVFIGSDPHVLYRIGTMLRDIGNFGIKEQKKLVKKEKQGGVDKESTKENG